MKATQKKATLDRFASDMVGVVNKYRCYGVFQNNQLCARCKVKKQCKAQTPKRRKL